VPNSALGVRPFLCRGSRYNVAVPDVPRDNFPNHFVGDLRTGPSYHFNVASGQSRLSGNSGPRTFPSATNTVTGTVLFLRLR
jgi:hypothetical protein